MACQPFKMSACCFVFLVAMTRVAFYPEPCPRKMIAHVWPLPSFPTQGISRETLRC